MGHLSKRGLDAVQTIEILTKARDFLREPGRWVRGDFIVSNDSQEPIQACAIGAIAVAHGQKQWHGSDSLDAMKERNGIKALMALADAIRPDRKAHHHNSEYLDYPWLDDIWQFNDGHEDVHMRRTNQDDVITAFDLAIEEQCKIVREEAREDD